MFMDLRLLWLISSLLEIGEPTVKTIISLCGGDTWSEIILLKKFRVKIARRAADL